MTDATAVLEHAVLVAIAPEELGCSVGDMRDSLAELVAGPRLTVLLDALELRGEVTRYEGGLYMLTPAGRRRVAAGPDAPVEPAPRASVARRPAPARRRSAPAKRDRAGVQIGPWKLVARVPSSRYWICACACESLARHRPEALRRARRHRVLRPCNACSPRVVADASREWAYQGAKPSSRSE